jgi:hypothetical protein
VAYSKTVVKSNGNKTSVFFGPFESEMYQTNVYLYGLYCKFYLNTFISVTSLMGTQNMMRILYNTSLLT